MTEPLQFRQFVEAGRGEVRPGPDVADRVLTTISTTPMAPVDRPLQWMAGLSVAAALMVMPSLMAESFYDPLGYWLSSLTVVMQ